VKPARVVAAFRVDAVLSAEDESYRLQPSFEGLAAALATCAPEACQVGYPATVRLR